MKKIQQVYYIRFVSNDDQKQQFVLIVQMFLTEEKNLKEG